MSDTPGQDGITPTPAEMVSLFQVGAVAVKFSLWLAVQAIRTDAAAFVDIEGGSG